MTEQQFLEKLLKVIEEYETKTENFIGCEIIFEDGCLMVYDGEKFIKTSENETK